MDIYIYIYIHFLQRGGAWAGPQPAQPFLAVPNVTAHSSTVSVPITVLLYDGPLLCRFNVAIKGLTRDPVPVMVLNRSNAIVPKSGRYGTNKSVAGRNTEPAINHLLFTRRRRGICRCHVDTQHSVYC